jgi:hypothetical protein
VEKDLSLVSLFPSRSAPRFSLWSDSLANGTLFLLLLSTVAGGKTYGETRFVGGTISFLRGSGRISFLRGSFLLWWLRPTPDLARPPRINVAFSEEKNYALEILSCHSNRLSIDFILKGSFKPTLMEGFGKGRIQPLQEIRWKKTHPQMDTEPIVK